MKPDDFPAWGVDWAWGLPIIIITVIFHAYVLGLLNRDVSLRLTQAVETHLTFNSVFVIGGTALAATLLHGVEAFGWAIAYRLLGASLSFKSAMLYSMSAITRHAFPFSADLWRRGNCGGGGIGTSWAGVWLEEVDGSVAGFGGWAHCLEYA